MQVCACPSCTQCLLYRLSPACLAASSESTTGADALLDSSADDVVRVKSVDDANVHRYLVRASELRAYSLASCV